MLEEIGLPELSLEQKENLCVLVEKAARNFINSKISLSEVQAMNIDVEIDGNMPTTVTVDIELVPSSSMKKYDVEQLANEATQRAMKAADNRFGEIACKSKT